jgi:hypothetical protein
MIFPFCKGSISFYKKFHKGAFLHYIEFLKTRRCNDYAFAKNAAAFYQKSLLTAEDGLIELAHKTTRISNRSTRRTQKLHAD